MQVDVGGGGIGEDMSLRTLRKAYTTLLLVNNFEVLSFPDVTYIRMSISCLLWWVNFQALFGCHEILILGKKYHKNKKTSYMTIAVNWDIEYHSTKQIF